MTDAASIDSDLNKQDELSREEILKQIFGDIGELIDGDDNFIFLISWLDYIFVFYYFSTFYICLIEKIYIYLYVFYVINIMYT